MTFLEFNAICGNNDILIKWTPATQTNKEYFTLERSIDVINFSAIARIKEHGRSVESLNYNYTGNSLEGGFYYSYRLKQADMTKSIELHKATNNEVVPLENLNLGI
jgi:hypothetical protein